jgi:hypothetical protein
MSKGGKTKAAPPQVTTTTPTTTTTTQTLDPAIRGAFLGNLRDAQRVAGNLGVRQFAGFDPLYLQGEQMALGAAGGAGSQALDAALAGTGGLTGFQPDRIAFDQGLVQQYYNPFQQEVIDATLGDLERQRQMASQGLGERAAAARAFGGSRQGVAEGVLAGEFGRTAAQTAAGLRQSGYQSALDRAMQQQQLNQQAGLQGALFQLGALQQQAGLGQARTAADYLAAQTAMGLGGTRQQLEQQRLDAARNLELERLGIRQSALGLLSPTMGATQTGTTSGGTTTTQGSTTTPYQNPAAGALGGALAGGTLFGTGGALAGVGGISAAGGAGLGALLGLI